MDRRLPRCSSVLALLACLAPSASQAIHVGGLVADPHIVEPANGVPVRDRSYGTEDESIAGYLGLAFAPYASTDATLMEADDVLRYCTENCILAGTINLPTGVHVTGLTIDYRDSGASGTVVVSLVQCPETQQGCFVFASLTSANDGDATRFTAVNHTVDNLGFTYAAQVNINGATTGFGLRHVKVHFERQVSPAPGTATFGDVPIGHAFFQHVEALAASGITAGCGGGNFCPGDPLTRGQMAVFLAKALGLHWPG